MKILLVYSSKTGNTKRVADAIYNIDKSAIDYFPVDKAPSPENYDLIILGYWIDKGEADLNTLQFARSLADKKILFFFTLGAYPDTEYSNSCVKRGYNMLQGNHILSHFHCQGKIDSKIIKRRLSLPLENPRYPTKEQLKRWQTAKTHPDISDLNRVVEAFSPYILQSSLEVSLDTLLVE